MTLIGRVLPVAGLAAILGVAALACDEGEQWSGTRSFDVGGYSMSITCEGQTEGLTVILDGGLVVDSSTWAKVQPEVAEFARVCSFDRPHLGKSDPRPQEEAEVSLVVEEMHALFREAGLEKPYVFASHSIAGINDRLYRSQHPGDVAGFVMVDAAFEEQFDLWREPTVLNENTPIDYSDAIATLRVDRAYGALGDLPLIVLHAEARRLDEAIWLSVHKQEAALSRNSFLIQANDSGHNIQKDQPDVVIAAVRALVESVSEDTQLPPCDEIATSLTRRASTATEPLAPGSANGGGGGLVRRVQRLDCQFRHRDI